MRQPIRLHACALPDTCGGRVTTTIKMRPMLADASRRRGANMLKRVEDVGLYYKRDLWGLLTGRRYQVLIQPGRREHLIPGRIHVDEFNARHQRSQVEPVCFGHIGERAYWRFGDRWFWDNEGLSSQDVRALVTTRDQRRHDTLTRAHSTVAMASRPAPAQRGAIPADVKQLVWRRDRGQCRLCGANTELQFDHIIPLSKGGATTEENLQILCGPCNRRKGASIV
jgi:5-methylcytosine-specific restriction endonuclease McrA